MLYEVSFPQDKTSVYLDISVDELHNSVHAIYEEYGFPFKLACVEPKYSPTYCFRTSGGSLVRMYFYKATMDEYRSIFYILERGYTPVHKKEVANGFKKLWELPTNYKLSE